MADVACTGYLTFSDGTAVPMFRSDLAEGTLEEVQTDADFTTSAQSIGDYAQGKTIVGGIVFAQNNISYAYLEREGQPQSLIMVGKIGVVGPGTYPCKPFTLKAGDKLQVLAQTASNRTFAVGVGCTDGTQRVFTVTGASGTVNPVDSITGNSLGTTLQGKMINQMYAVSIDGVKNTSGGGVVAIDAQGSPVGACSATDPTLEAPMMSPHSIPVKLNYSFVCTFSS